MIAKSWLKKNVLNQPLIEKIGFFIFVLAAIWFARNVLGPSLRNVQAFSDLQSFYFPAKAMLKGLNFYSPDVANPLGIGILRGWQGIGPYLYPPTLLWLFAPLTYLSYAHARIAWTLLILFASLILWREFKLNKRQNIPFWLCSAALLLFSPIYRTFLYGGVDIFILLLIWLAFRWYQQKKLYPGAVALGLAAAIKLFPLFLLLYFAIRKQWKFCIVTLLVTILMITSSFLVLPRQQFTAYFQTVIPKLIKGEASQQTFNGNDSYAGTQYWPSNHSLLGFLSHTLTQQEVTHGFINNRQLVTILWIIGSVIILGLTVFAAFKYFKPDTESIVFSLFLIAFLLINPLTWEKYLVLVLPCFFFLLNDIFRDNWRKSLNWLVLFLFLFIIFSIQLYPWNQIWRSGFGTIILSIRTLALITLLVSTMSYLKLRHSDQISEN